MREREEEAGGCLVKEGTEGLGQRMGGLVKEGRLKVVVKSCWFERVVGLKGALVSKRESLVSKTGRCCFKNGVVGFKKGSRRFKKGSCRFKKESCRFERGVVGLKGELSVWKRELSV